MNLNLQEKVGIMQIYAPTENATADEKDAFYEELQRETERLQNKNQHVIVMEDWNAHIGNQERRGHGTMGKHGLECEINNNGQRMLDFCIINQILIGNTWFNHKNIHKITYEVQGLEHRSMIDYITYTKNMRYAVNDVKAIREAELSTAHRLVIAHTNIENPKKERNRKYEKIKLELLEEPNKRREYEERLQKKLEEYENLNQQQTLNEV